MISRLYNIKSRIFDSIERRFRRSRPGSVLILVVALLVLLALLGTAYINTAQSDRYSSAQNSFNTEVELLLQGLENVTQGTIVNALYGPAFHTDSTTPPATAAQPIALTDYPLNKPSAFLADRFPTLGTSPATATNLPIWGSISMLPLVPTSGFESPYALSPSSPQYYSPLYKTRQGWSPYFVNILQGNTTQTFPAWWDGTHLYLAADTDGDGIADAGLFRLPIGELNGITYYGAVRVIDNCAAINAAIAWAPNPTSATLPGNFFPTNIDLSDLLLSGDQGANFTNFNTTARFNGQASLSPTPYDDAGNPRGDFTFGSPYEAFWMQVGRRIANPGYYTTGSSGQYTALPISEMATMARRFIIRDPSVTSFSSSPSLLEQYLPASVYTNAPSSSYAAGDVVNWYNKNFDFMNPSGLMSIRSMLVTQNGVSNFTYGKLHSTGTTTTTGATGAGATATPGTTTVTAGVWSNTLPYNFGDWVTYTYPSSYTDPTSGRSTTMTRTYVCMQQNTGQLPTMNPTTVNGFTVPQPASSQYWEPQPWTTGPTKASANTATFGQLWSAYYSAMTETPITVTSSGTVSLGTVTKAAHQAMFRTSLRTASQPNWDPGAAGEFPNPGTPGFPQLQLRAAIAAINTLQLRNPNSASAGVAPLSATINLTDVTGALAYKAIVYGSAPQPYITEVYASTMGTNPYVAVELYNPYPFNIPLTGWQLASIPRTAGAALGAPTLIPWGAAPPAIPGGGFITLVTVNPDPDMPAGGQSPTGTVVVVPTLASALGSELVLLRPAPATAPPSGWSSGLTATVPVDSYDFTGLSATDVAPGHDWHYIRPNDPGAGKAWHFVYPGPLTGSGKDAMNPRERGTNAQAGPAPQIMTLATFGALDAAPAVKPTNSQNSYIDRPLQINNTAFGGPNKPTASPYAFPYGGFARNADLLQVTYVGAYQITDSTGGTLYELNALPADSAMADDPNLSNDQYAVTSEQLGRQNIGRFTPVHWADTLITATNPPYTSYFTSELNAFQQTQQVGMPPAAPYPYAPDDYYWSAPATMVTGYHWTSRLLDYVTVQSPQDDYLPDVDPGTSNAPGTAPVYPGTTPASVANATKTIANASVLNSPSSATEETVPVHGRININTANWRILATLPFFDNPYNQAAANDLARAIVYYRDVDDGTSTSATPPLHPHGAFQSIEELNNVMVAAGSNPMTLAVGTSLRTAFGKYNGNFVIPGPHGTNIDGDLSPNSATPGADQVIGDFENQNLALNRISNLITTRSDSFTAYVMVQGWRNVGTTTPQLVVQRRAAFIIDRSTITPANNTQAAITNVGY